MATSTDASDLESFLAKDYESGKQLQDKVTELIGTIGENISVRRFARYKEDGVKYIGYLHGAGKIGVIIGLKTDADVAAVENLGKDIAMQVASMNPLFIDESSVDPTYLENEKDILVRQVMSEGKPENIAEKMVTGRINKLLKEICLVEQKFVKNNDITIAQYVKDTAQSLGKEISITTMVRYEVGEGIEKKQENFADEVAKQIG
jgi:elongation factor Ts